MRVWVLLFFVEVSVFRAVCYRFFRARGCYLGFVFERRSQKPYFTWLKPLWLQNLYRKAGLSHGENVSHLGGGEQTTCFQLLKKWVGPSKIIFI